MNRTMTRRIAVLEGAASAELPAAIRQWLGWPMTDAERAAIPPLVPMTETEEKEFDQRWHRD